MTAAGYNIYLSEVSGVYSQPGFPDARFSVDGDMMLSMTDQDKLIGSITTWTQLQSTPGAMPFRLSFFGYATLDVQFDPLLKLVQSGITTSNSEETLYSVIEGTPFSTYSRNYPLYEPDLDYLWASLGQDTQSLSQTDQERFMSLVVPSQTHSTTESIASAALKRTYDHFKARSDFQPASVSSPYASGCASYCVASEPIETGTPDYFANYKKVYQLGTPSARLIVLQDAKTNDVAGILSLNVAETVSTLTTIEKLQIEPHSVAETYLFHTYDRYGRPLYSNQGIFENSPFENLFK
jgi:hypothetical protein